MRAGILGGVDKKDFTEEDASETQRKEETWVVSGCEDTGVAACPAGLRIWLE